ncbi:MAG: hypothetical protein U0Q07_19025 [Acidimicrobiales bacterium]
MAVPPPSSVLATVVAHQGGWDEALMVLVPIALIVWVLKVANDRAKRQRAEADALAAGEEATRAAGAAHEAAEPASTDEP